MRFLTYLQSISVLFIVLGMNTTIAAVEKWTSADGFFSVEVPDATEFHQVENPPEPFVVLWINNTESCKLGVLSIAHPSGKPLSQASVESGLAEEIGAPVERLPTKKFGNKSLWTMVAKKDDNVSLYQSLTIVPGKIYKSMGLATDAKMAETAFKFVDTTTVDDPIKKKVDALREQVLQKRNSSADRPTNPPSQKAKVTDSNAQTSPIQLLSKAMGGIGVLVAMIAAILWIKRRNRKK